MRTARWMMALLLAVPAAAQKNDWLIVPGQRVGPITAQTTRADLDALFGKENVQDGSYLAGDLDGATVVYGSEKAAALGVTWDRERVATVHICFSTETGPCRWRTASGIRLGMPLQELQKINGKTFQVAGFGSGQGNVVSWRKGMLEEDAAACGHLAIGVEPLAKAVGQDLSKDEASALKPYQNEKPASSSALTMTGLNPIVSSLTLEFSGAGCGK